MRLKKSFGLLMVLLILPLAFAGIARSTAAASLTLAPMSGGVYASGNGWTPNGVVTFYFDSQNAAHMVTTVKASSAGSFNFVAIPIGSNVALAPHTIIAVQGANMATATYTPSSVSPPDDRLLNPILAIQNSLGAVEGKIDAIEDKLDSGGSFYTFVGSWFTTTNTKIDAISKAEQLLFQESRSISSSGLNDYVTSIYTADASSKPAACVYTITYYVNYANALDYIHVYVDHNNQRPQFPGYIIGHDGAGVFQQTGTFAASSMEIWIDTVNPGGLVWWSVTVEGAPGTVVTHTTMYP
jgi:hypothetical protein